MKENRFLSKSKVFWLALFFCLTAQSACSQSAQQQQQPFSLSESPLPAPTGFVNDYAGVIDAGTKQTLEAKIKAFKEKTNPQIELAVAIVKTTAERPIFDYSLAVSRGWKIGSKANDNPSALLFIAIDDRKYFTQVSKDLEDELPDGLVGQLNRQYLVPAFKQADYGKGVSDTIDAYIKTIEAKQTGQPQAATTETNAENEKKNSTRNSSGGLPFGNCMTCLIILFIILIIIFSSRGGRGGGGGGGGGRRNRWGGGGFGGSALPWIIGSAIGSSGGWGSSSSGGSGGSSSSGGSDWGGFGGGGDFGGGGAGGDW